MYYFHNILPTIAMQYINFAMYLIPISNVSNATIILENANHSEAKKTVSYYAL